MSVISLAFIYAGLALAGTGTAFAVLEWLRTRADPLQARMRDLAQSAGAKAKSLEVGEEDRSVLVGVGIGFVLGLLLGWGYGSWWKTAIFGAALGYGGAKLVTKSMKDRDKAVKMREIALIAETVDFMSEVKYSIAQSLAFASALTPRLKPVVDRCLARWPFGPERALTEFAQEVNVPEAAMLASVLVHAQKSGMEQVYRILQEESRSLESLRKTLAEVSIASKPIYFAVYRGLPLAAIGGILVGPLVYRVLKLLVDTMGGGLGAP